MSIDYKTELLALGIDYDTVQQFISYHKRNPLVWLEFEKVALQACWDGKKHWGAKSIAEIVRYNLKKQAGSRVTLDNKYTSYYARIFTIKHPDFKDFFEFRQLKGLKSEAA